MGFLTRMFLRNIMDFFEISTEDVYFFNETHITFYTDSGKSNLVVFKFPDDMKQTYHETITNVVKSKNKMTLFVADSYVHCLSVGHTAYPSSKASPTTFGWAYSP
ncbi:hypothetical protein YASMINEVIRUS_327 [Yasminevirus sp. GU-2018]|uniref:Uncharacterized protein n=1 Tax=Yasminevirus sp. GU-2018 TaxID=2420051 RepID=A0A5K0U8R1_9VIRU|nr:hypothetical protein YASMINEVIRUS_327 [Yasminevirus sp. GU-2018]